MFSCGLCLRGKAVKRPALYINNQRSSYLQTDWYYLAQLYVYNSYTQISIKTFIEPHWFEWRLKSGRIIRLSAVFPLDLLNHLQRGRKSPDTFWRFAFQMSRLEDVPFGGWTLGVQKQKKCSQRFDPVRDFYLFTLLCLSEITFNNHCLGIEPDSRWNSGQGLSLSLSPFEPF